MKKYIQYLGIFVWVIGWIIMTSVYLFQNTTSEIDLIIPKETNLDIISSEIRVVSREELPNIDISKNERIVVSGEAMEVRNIKESNDASDHGRRGFGSRWWDIYLDGRKIVENFPFWCWDGCDLPKYNKDRNIIFANEGYWDVCWWFSSYIEYGISTGKYNWVDRGFNGCFISQNTIIPWWNKKDYTISTYADLYWSGLTDNYSVISISMTWGLRRNYIYNNSEALSTKEDFLQETSKYIFAIWWKELAFDFSDLENAKDMMPVLWYWWNGNNDGYFDYQMYLTRLALDDAFVLHFDKVKIIDFWGESSKKVKNIWIISCKSNNSKEYDTEYVLKTKDENGNFQYNISEKLGNKCDIPYKVSVYYTDNTIEIWEYYVLFDY